MLFNIHYYDGDHIEDNYDNSNNNVNYSDNNVI